MPTTSVSASYTVTVDRAPSDYWPDREVRERRYRPDRVVLHYSRWDGKPAKLHTTEIAGPLIKRNGTVGAVRVTDQIWYDMLRPEWLVRLIEESSEAVGAY